MAQIDIPPELFKEIDQTRPPTVSPAEYVTQAVREKLDKEHRAEEFLRLAAENREAMLARGLTEEQVIADFEAWRRERHG